MVFVRLLDRAKQSRRERALWRCEWPGHGYPYLRLDPDLVDWFTSLHTLVGASQHRRRLRLVLLDRRANTLLHKRESTRPDCCLLA